ncbi:MAG: dethiobiotin synthase [Flavobacteriales bacterium]|nr:dethiobiotin synthase [Flavobacteriales bacterium]
MNTKTIFVAGISTEVGKTFCSTILTESLQADYWKPLQSGNLDELDSSFVKNMLSNTKSKIHKETYLLSIPESPHYASEKDNITITIKGLQPPKTNNNLIIEGVGGIMVPINNQETMADLMSVEDYVILVSRHYLGSINHTLLSLEYLKQKGFKKVAVLFNGEEKEPTENIIPKFFPDVMYLGRIPEIKTINKENIKNQADNLHDKLTEFLTRHEK